MRKSPVTTPYWTAVVYRTGACAPMIPLVSPHPSPRMPCGWLSRLLHSLPGSRRDRTNRSSPVQVARNELIHRPGWRRAKVTTPLLRFGSDRMWDFEQVGPANLWKSGPFFSTGAGRTEPVAAELRLNLCLRASSSGMALRVREQEEMDGDFDPRLSTAFAKAGRRLPPARRAPAGQA